MVEQTIAIDPSNEYEESAGYNTGSEYSTESLASSIYEYRYENGRRYHSYADGKYAFPNDEAEQDRLDIIHHICLLLLDDELTIAPIGESPQRILDVGTGTGIWAIDAGEQTVSVCPNHRNRSEPNPAYLARITPLTNNQICADCISRVPPNVQFQIDDAEATWTWSKNSFDLVHMRHLSGAIKDWPSVIKEAYKCVKPGGYLAIHEYDMDFYSDDGTYTDKTYLWKFCDLVNKACDKSGRGFQVVQHMSPMLEAAGFVDVERHTKKVPMGTWASDPKMKNLGAFFLLTSDNAFEAMALALGTRELGMSVEEVRVIVDGAKKDAKNKRIHSYAKQWYYLGRKPEEK